MGKISVRPEWAEDVPRELVLHTGDAVVMYGSFQEFFPEIGEVGFSLNRRVCEGKNATLGSPLPARRERAGSLELDEEKRSAQHFLQRPGPRRGAPAANTRGNPMKSAHPHLDAFHKMGPAASVHAGTSSVWAIRRDGPRDLGEEKPNWHVRVLRG